MVANQCYVPHVRRETDKSYKFLGKFYSVLDGDGSIFAAYMVFELFSISTV